MKSTRALIWLTLIGVLILTGCGGIPTPLPQTQVPPATTEPESASEVIAPTQPPVTPEPLAAIVNGQAILLSEYERQIALYEASMSAAGQDPNTQDGQTALKEARGWVLDRMIEQLLIEQAAMKAGISVSEEEVNTTIQNLMDEIGEETFKQRLETEGLTLEEMRTELHREMVATQMASQIAEQIPSVSAHIHARHILLNTEGEARQILAQLQAGADFEELARRYSQDNSTRDIGGDLGFFPVGILTSPEVEAVAFELQPGQTSDVIQSPLGYHIIQVIERVPDMEVTPENMRLLQDKAVRTWLEGLWSMADIQRFVPATSPSSSVPDSTV